MNCTPVSDPWIAWLFDRTFLYPLPPSGLPDLLVTGNDRDGIGYIGSFYYSQEEEVSPQVEQVEDYMATGGKAPVDLRDVRRFPKASSAAYWFLDTRMAGVYFPRIGDVTGPDKTYGSWFDRIPPAARRGWRWTKDPKFAWVLVNF